MGSPIAAGVLVAAAVRRGGSSFVRRDRAHERGEPSGAAPMDCEEAPGPPAAAAALAALETGAGDCGLRPDAAAVEGIEVPVPRGVGAVGSGDDAALAAMASDVDALVSDLAARVAAMASTLPPPRAAPPPRAPASTCSTR